MSCVFGRFFIIQKRDYFDITVFHISGCFSGEGEEKKGWFWQKEKEPEPSAAGTSLTRT